MKKLRRVKVYHCNPSRKKRSAWATIHKLYRRNPARSRAGVDKHVAHQLLLYTVNDSRLYHGQAQAIILNLARKMKKGSFSLAKSIKLWQYLADTAAKKYAHDFGDIFPVSTRRETARELARHYWDEVKDKYRSMR